MARKPLNYWSSNKKSYYNPWSPLPGAVQSFLWRVWPNITVLQQHDFTTYSANHATHCICRDWGTCHQFEEVLTQFSITSLPQTWTKPTLWACSWVKQRVWCGLSSNQDFSHEQLVTGFLVKSLRPAVKWVTRNCLQVPWTQYTGNKQYISQYNGTCFHTGFILWYITI